MGGRPDTGEGHVWLWLQGESRPPRLDGGHGRQPHNGRYLLFLVSYCRMFLMK